MQRFVKPVFISFTYSDVAFRRLSGPAADPLYLQRRRQVSPHTGKSIRLWTIEPPSARIRHSSLGRPQTHQVEMDTILLVTESLLRQSHRPRLQGPHTAAQRGRPENVSLTTTTTTTRWGKIMPNLTLRGRKKDKNPNR
jgi:hypothetical protein